MKKSTKVLLISTIGVFTVTGIAMAAKGYHEHQKMHRLLSPTKILEQIDTNGDQAITIDELNGAMAKRFALADADNDGSITKTDVVAAIDENVAVNRIKRHSGKIADRFFIGADINNDNAVTKSEIENRMEKFYALADWNDDGKVEIEELERLRASTLGRWGKNWRRER